MFLLTAPQVHGIWNQNQPKPAPSHKKFISRYLKHLQSFKIFHHLPPPGVHAKLMAMFVEDVTETVGGSGVACCSLAHPKVDPEISGAVLVPLGQ